MTDAAHPSIYRSSDLIVHLIILCCILLKSTGQILELSHAACGVQDMAISLTQSPDDGLALNTQHTSPSQIQLPQVQQVCGLIL